MRKRHFRFRLENNKQGTLTCVDNTDIYALLDSQYVLGTRRADFVGKRRDPSVEFGAQELLDDLNRLGLAGLGGPIMELGEVKLSPGEYHPRIWRQVSGPHPSTYGSELTSCLVAFDNLEADLEAIFRTLEPATSNDKAFGHHLREVIILACTEVENLFKELFRANGLPPGRGTKDYIRALPVLRLDDWSVGLRLYRDYPKLQPFVGWSAPETTKTLTWYESYNAVKHDRSGSFSKATMATALSSVAAVAVLLAAQFGVGGMSHNPLAREKYVFRVFSVLTSPDFPVQDQYAPASNWVSKPLLF